MAGKAPTKGQILGGIADKTGLTRKQVASVFESLTEQIVKNLSKKGPGVFQLPGLCKMIVRTKPATKERVGLNRFTGQMQTFKAKPASRVVRIRPLKALKTSI